MLTRRLFNWLVGLGIACIVLAMVAGAVLRVREEAHFTLCQSNLRMLAIACHNYHTDYHCLPPATAWGTNLPPEKRFSWQAFLLPQYVQANFYDRHGNQLDFKQPWDHVYASTGGKTSGSPVISGLYEPRMFWCPSNSGISRADGFPLGHYIGIAGVGVDAPTLPKDSPLAGIFGYEDRGVTLDWIASKDGTSNTLLIMETAHANGPWMAGGYSTCRGLDPKNELPYFGRPAQFSSYHVGGRINVAFADGSTRWFSPSLADPKVFEAVATMAGGEPIPRLDD